MWRKFVLGAILLLVVQAFVACDQQPSPADSKPADSKKAPPFGVVDVPHNGDTVGREVEVGGWALGSSPIKEVKIYVDGQYKLSAKLKLPRPDVTKVYPAYATPEEIHGWLERVDLGDRAGNHTLLAQAVDDNGATTDIGSVIVKAIER
jgi:hypothetical protein